MTDRKQRSTRGESAPRPRGAAPEQANEADYFFPVGTRVNVVLGPRKRSGTVLDTSGDRVLVEVEVGDSNVVVESTYRADELAKA